MTSAEALDKAAVDGTTAAVHEVAVDGPSTATHEPQPRPYRCRFILTLRVYVDMLTTWRVHVDMVPSHRVNVAMSAVDRAAVAVDELQWMGPSTATSRTAAVVSFTAALSNASALVKCQSLLEVLWELGADMRGSRQVASPTPPPPSHVCCTMIMCLAHRISVCWSSLCPVHIEALIRARWTL